MSDIDLEEISIVSFETAERKPEEAEVEMVEVRAVRAAERENVRGGECEGEYACEVQAPAIGRCAGRAFCPVTWCMRGRAAGSRGGGAHRGPLGGGGRVSWSSVYTLQTIHSQTL